MDPVTFILGGSGLAMIAGFGRIVYKYGQDRKELNGTVERVKVMEHDMKDLRKNVSYIRGSIDSVINNQQD